MKRFIIALGLSLFILSTALAQETTPEELIKQTTEQVLAALEENAALIEEDPEKIQEMVGEIVLPHFDFVLMSQLVLARHWREADSEQQKRFVREFRQLLIRTYGTSLSHYSGQKVEFLPSKPDPNPKRATVRTLIRQSEGSPIPVNYQLRQTGDSWKVFDVVIEGISLVQNYRSSFAAEIQQSGLDGLIERVHERNTRPRKG